MQQPNIYYHYSAPWQQWILSDYLKCLQVKPGEQILDVGCGVGNNFKTYADFGLKITGIEPSEFALKHCADRWRHIDPELVIGVGENLPFENNSCSLIVCTEVLEHATDPQKVVQEINRILAPGGHCILSCQTYLNIAGIIKCFMSARGQKDWDAWGDSGGQTENFLFSVIVRRWIGNSDFLILKERGADYLNAFLVWLPSVRQNYKLLDRFPLLPVGRLPLVRHFAMDYFFLLKKQ